MPRLFAVPLPWRTKKLQAVSVDYKFGQMCGNKKFIRTTNINDAVENARRWLADVDTEIHNPPAGWKQHFKDNFLKYFSINPESGGNGAHVEEVRRVVRATKQGVDNPLHVAAICRWGGGETSTQGYVRPYADGSQGRIHVALPQFKGTKKKDLIEQACIIVHEATHKFADTDDASYKGAANFPPAAILDALKCADCYTYFIRDTQGGETLATLEKNSWANIVHR